MIIATIVILLFAWVGISLWWVYQELHGNHSTPDSWWTWFKSAPVLGILWVVEQAQKAKKHGIK